MDDGVFETEFEPKGVVPLIGASAMALLLGGFAFFMLRLGFRRPDDTGAIVIGGLALLGAVIFAGLAASLWGSWSPRPIRIDAQGFSIDGKLAPLSPDLRVVVRLLDRHLWALLLLDTQGDILVGLPIEGFRGESHMQSLIAALVERGVVKGGDGRPDIGIKVAQRLDRERDRG